MKKLFRIATVPISLNILLKGQLRYLNQYYEVTAVSGPGEELDEVKAREGVKTHEIIMEREISPFKDLISLIRLYHYFKKEKPDIVHSITPKAGLLSMIAGRLAGVPVRMHTFTGLIFPYKKGFLKFILIWMDRLLANSATHIYPEGAGVKKDLEFYRITRKPLKIIAQGNINGIDHVYFHPDQISIDEQEHLKRKLGISCHDFVFIFVGRLVRDKGINELVAAFKKISEEYDASSGSEEIQPKLLLVGPFEQHLDPLKAETLKEIKTNCNIISVGFQAEVRPYFSISDALVFASYREGFPNVVLQGLAMNLPVIVTDINGCNEIITSGTNGLIIPVKDEKALKSAIENLLNDTVLYTQLKSKTRPSALPFDQKTVWEALLMEYQSAVKDGVKGIFNG